MAIYILVEGDSDEIFLNSYIKYLRTTNSDFEKDIEIISTWGKDNIKAHINDKKIKKALDDEKVCIIFDADSSHKESLETIQKSLQEKLGDKAREIGIFLFPNNKDTGNLETLLEKIAKKPELIECFDCYVKCIESKEKGASKNIDKKARIYAYKQVFGLIQKEKKEKDKKENDKSYQMQVDDYQKCFDFEHEALENLKNFLFKQHNK